MLSTRYIARVGLVVLVVGGGLASVPSAEAQWYVSGNVGAAILGDADVTDTFTGGNITAEVEFDTGLGLSGAVGHAWGNFRLEGEFSNRKNDLDAIDVQSLTIAGVLFTALGTADLTGDTSSFGFMANGWYDVDTGTKWVPFVGAGLGVAKINIDVESVAGVAVVYDESDTVFAYQVGAGIGYKVTPTVTVNLAYRFFGTSDPEFDDGVDKIDSEYHSHNITVGVVARF